MAFRGTPVRSRRSLGDSARRLRDALWIPAHRIDRLSRGLVVFMFLILFALLLTEILARTIFNEALGWIIELAQYMLIAIVWTGAIAFTRMDAHIRVTFFIDLLSRLLPSSTRFFALLGRLGSLLFLATVVFASGGLALTSYDTLSPGMHIRFAYLYCVITVSSALMCYFLLELLMRDSS